MALDKTKTDPLLGEEIHCKLLELGVETPTKATPTDDFKKMEIIEVGFKGILATLGMDLSDDSLSGTPKRIAKMFVKEIFWGLDYSNFPKITTIENKMGYSSMLTERNIRVNSTCEHHFVSIIGEAHISYIPNKKIIGLSKLNRVVEFFSKRPQVQERLVEQIYAALSHILDTEDVAVVVRAKHLCVQVRGVEDSNSDTITSRLGGLFYSGELRNEFFQSINL